MYKLIAVITQILVCITRDIRMYYLQLAYIEQVIYWILPTLITCNYL